MTKPLANEILRSARIAELHDSVSEVAKLAKAVSFELPRNDKRARARLIRLLARERKRSAKLIAELIK
jgi:hypothetical protein